MNYRNLLMAISVLGIALPAYADQLERDIKASLIPSTLTSRFVEDDAVEFLIAEGHVQPIDKATIMGFNETVKNSVHDSKIVSFKFLSKTVDTEYAAVRYQVVMSHLVDGKTVKVESVNNEVWHNTIHGWTYVTGITEQIR